MKALLRLRNLIFGYELVTNPEKGLNFLEVFWRIILVGIIISFCGYVISLFKKKRPQFYQKEFTSKERAGSKKYSEEAEEKLRQEREKAEAKEGEVSIYTKPKKSEPKKNNTGEYVDFENIDNK